MQNKRGISGIVSAVIMIGIVMAAGALIWGVVNSIVSEGLGEAEACFNIYGKVTLNNRYTCYNKTSKEVFFSVNIEDIDLDGIIVRISSAGESKSYTIKKDTTAVAGLSNYSRGSTITLPGANSGVTYIATGIANNPDSIDIVPIVKGKQCDISDSINQIDSCRALSSL